MDEVSVERGSGKGTIGVFRTAAEKYDNDCVVPTTTKSNDLIFWESLGDDQKGVIVLVREDPGSRGKGVTSAHFRPSMGSPPSWFDGER